MFEKIGKRRWWFLAGVSVFLAVLGFYLTFVVLLQQTKLVVVPDINGYELAPAMEELNRLGLNARVEKEDFSDRFEAGRVMSQRPLAGRKSKEGRQVFLTISKGLQQLAMPDLLDMDEKLAEQILANNHLKLSRLLSLCSESPAGKIVAQKPEPFNRLPRQASIELAVSSGECSRWTVLSDFRDQPLYLIRRQLENSHIAYQLIEGKEESNDIEKATVVDQQPKSGTLVSWSNIVQLQLPIRLKQWLSRPLRFYYLHEPPRYGFFTYLVTVRTYFNNLQAMQPLEIDNQFAAGKNIEWIIPTIDGLLPQVIDVEPFTGLRLKGFE